MGKLTRSMLPSALRATGLQVARFDFHAPTSTLYLTTLVHKRVHHLPIPTGRPITVDEICQALFRTPEPCAIAHSDPPPP